LADVVPTAGDYVIGEYFEDARFFFRTFDWIGVAKYYHRSVIYRMMECGARKHQAIH
jgi:hypothetical protein